MAKEVEDFMEYDSYKGVDLMFINTVKSLDIEKRMEEIKSFKMKKGEVLLSTYPKSGMLKNLTFFL